MKTELLLFASQFGAIFLLGLQQHNVHARRFGAAAVTSLVLGAMQAFSFRKIPNATPTELVAWLVAGPLGIVAAMWVYPRIFKNDK